MSEQMTDPETVERRVLIEIAATVPVGTFTDSLHEYSPMGYHVPDVLGAIMTAEVVAGWSADEETGSADVYGHVRTYCFDAATARITTDSQGFQTLILTPTTAPAEPCAGAGHEAPTDACDECAPDGPWNV